MSLGQTQVLLLYSQLTHLSRQSLPGFAFNVRCQQSCFTSASRGEVIVICRVRRLPICGWYYVTPHNWKPCTMTLSPWVPSSWFLVCYIVYDVSCLPCHFPCFPTSWYVLGHAMMRWSQLKILRYRSQGFVSLLVVTSNKALSSKFPNRARAWASVSGLS